MASRPISSRPCGTGRACKSNPGLTSWAKFSRPSGTQLGNRVLTHAPKPAPFDHHGNPRTRLTFGRRPISRTNPILLWRLNGNTLPSCLEEKLRRERDDFSPVALEKRIPSEAVKHRLFTAPCPSLDGLFPELLGSPKAPALAKFASLKNLIWTGLKFSRPRSTSAGQALRD